VLIAALTLGAPFLQVDEAPKLRTRLSNGATLIVERAPLLKSCAIAIAFRADRCIETPETHGWRHLLEHIAAKGIDGKLDVKLESRGWMSTAWTYRDSMVFAAIGNKELLGEALIEMASIPKTRKTTQDAMTRESKIITQEMALVSPAQRFSNRAWNDHFGTRGLDAWGSSEVIAKASPADFARLATQQFDSRGMAVAIVGDISVASVSESVRRAFGEITSSEWPVIEVERKFGPDSSGGASAIGLPPAGSDDWIAKIGAALALSEEDTSTTNSLFSISFRPGLLAMFPRPKRDASGLPVGGRRAFLGWLDGIERSSLSRATVLAQLAIVSPDLSIDRLRANAGGIAESSFASAIKELLK